MTVSSKSRVVDRRGRPIALGSKIGEGGEGAVFNVEQHPDVVAKLYHKPLDTRHAAKLSAMITVQSEKLGRVAAWPLDTLHEDSPSRAAIGFLMPRVQEYQPIHILYGPKSRLAEFPDATWHFLVHAAANVARAVSTMHEHGVVIGDINHANVVVAKNATVKLIDCDSFQMTTNGTRYLCEVGVETHTPPELQGRSFRQVPRTPNHDAFGLAVTIFQLLFLGRHPFVGQYLGDGDMPIDRAIREFRFAYGPDARAHQMAQPRGALPLSAVSQPVARLFERAFSRSATIDRGRPSAKEWIEALESLRRALRRCNRNGSHYFPSSLTSCPLCSVEVASGAFFFAFTSAATSGTNTQFDFKSIWPEIAAVQPPGPLPAVPSTTSFAAGPSERAIELGRKRRNRRIMAAGFFIFGVVVAIAAGGAAIIWILLVTVIVTVVVGRGGNRQEIANIRKRLLDAQAQLQAIEARWLMEASPERFNAKIRELQASKNQYEGLERSRQEKLQRLHAQMRERQLQRYLDSHRIMGAGIPGIGAGRAMALQSNGIETAADVAQAKILAIPGFGPSLTHNLVDWQKAVQRKFAFDPRRGIDPADVQAIDREILAIRSRLELDLRTGPSTLRLARQQALTLRDAIWPSLEAAVREVAQAEADVNAVG